MAQVLKDGSQALKKPLWDWQLRLCHWLMVVLIAACWWTADIREIVYHGYCAYALLGVLVFRLYWGFFGSSSARFSQFLTGPAAVWRYVKNLAHRQAPVHAGHNPVGGYSALVLWFLLLLQIGLGLFSIDVDGFDGGPFTELLKFKTSRMITGWHEIVFNVLLAFIALHLLAILYYRVWRRQNLTAAMVHGKAAIATGVQTVSGWRTLVGLLLAFAAIGGLLLL